MRLVIVRHGETIENAKRVFQGQIHGTLSKKGIKQAKQLAKRLKNRKFNAVYSSDLKRAVDTAKEILLFHPNLRLIKDKRLRERNIATYENSPIPKDFDWQKLPKEFETDKEMCQRAGNFLKDIKIKHPEESVLIVCHGGTKMALLTIIHKFGYREFKRWEGIKNTSVSECEIDDKGNFQLLKINSTKHLGKHIEMKEKLQAVARKYCNLLAGT